MEGLGESGAHQIYANDGESQIFMNVLQLKGPYIMHKFRTSDRVHLDIDWALTRPNITFDDSYNGEKYQINM